MNASSGRVVAHGQPLSKLVNVLSPQLQRKVIDRTGLTADYDFELTWTPDEILANLPPTSVGGQAPDAGPSIFAALQEQLGLKLESS